MFRRRRNQNTAVIDVPPAAAKAQTVTYDNRVPWVGIVVVLFGCFVLVFPLTWWAGVYIFEQAGLHEHEARRAMAQTVIGTSILIFVMAILSAIGRLFLNNILAHRERMKQFDLDALEIRLEAARHWQLTAQAQPAATTGRMTEENTRWCWIITAVMFTAFERYATGGEFSGNWRPWSRRSVQALKLRDGSQPTEAEASRVQGWLTENGIVRKNQINVDRYPDLAAVQALLNRLFDAPIQVTAGGSATPLRSNDGYKFV